MEMKIGDKMVFPEKPDWGLPETQKTIKEVTKDEIVLGFEVSYTKFLVDKNGLNVRDKDGNCVVDFEGTGKGESRMPLSEAQKLTVISD